jgi:hypothetical protein
MSHKRKAEEEPDNQSAEKKHKAAAAADGEKKPAQITIACGDDKATVNLEMLRLFCKNPLLSTDGIGVEPLQDGGVLALDKKTLPFITAHDLYAFAHVMNNPFNIAETLKETETGLANRIGVFLLCDYLDVQPMLCTVIMDAAIFSYVTDNPPMDSLSINKWGLMASRLSGAMRGKNANRDHVRGYAWSLAILVVAFNANHNVDRSSQIPDCFDNKQLLWDTTRAQIFVEKQDTGRWSVNHDGIVSMLQRV